MATTSETFSVKRAAFMELAGQLFDRMLGQEQQHQLVTFTQREARALELGKKLQTALLEEHLGCDPLACPGSGQAVCCPVCGRPGELRKDKAERELRAQTGKVRWRRDVYYCGTCRRSFSPSGGGVGPEPGGVQPGASASDRDSGRPVCV